MKSLWKKISAVTISAVMLISATAQAAITANHLDSTDMVPAVTFYGNDENVITVDGGSVAEADSQAPLSGKTAKFDVNAIGQWNYKKLTFAKENDYTEEERVDISGYEEKGYIGMYIKVETEAESYPLGLNFWEHDTNNPNTTNPTVMNSAHSLGWEYGVDLNGDYINKWAFVTIPLSTMHKNAKATLKHIYQMQLMAINPAKAATVYVQGLGVYTSAASTDTNGLSTTLTWVSVDGATRYEVKRDTNFDGSFSDVLTSNCTDTTFTDTTVPANGVYKYAIKAYKGDEGISTRIVYANVTGDVLQQVQKYYGNEATGYGRDGNWKYEAQSDAPMGGYAMSATHSNYHESTGLYRSIIDLPVHSLADYWEDGYLCFYLRTQYSEDLTVFVQCSDVGGYKNVRYTVPGSSILPGRWNFVKIKLTDFAVKSELDTENIAYVMFAQTKNEGVRKIQGLGIYMPTEANLKINSSLNNGSVALNWTTTLVDAAKYEIYRNGIKLADTTEKTYTDTPSDNAVYYYTVKAIGADGNVICKDETIVGIKPADEEMIVSIYGNESNVSVADSSIVKGQPSPLGGAYIAKSSDKTQTVLNKNSDWTGATDDDYITFYYYFDAEAADDFVLEAYSEGWKSAQWKILAGNAELGKWNIARVRLGNTMSKHEAFDLSKVIQVKLVGAGFKNTEIAWQGMRIVKGPKCVSVKSVRLESQNTFDVPEWVASEEVAVTAEVNNATASAVMPVMFVAYYDKNDKFKGMKIINNTTSVAAETSASITGSFIIPEIENPRVRIMIWDSLNGLTPYSTVYGNVTAE